MSPLFNVACNAQKDHPARLETIVTQRNTPQRTGSLVLTHLRRQNASVLGENTCGVARNYSHLTLESLWSSVEERAEMYAVEMVSRGTHRPRTRDPWPRVRTYVSRRMYARLAACSDSGHFFEMTCPHTRLPSIAAEAAEDGARGSE